MIDSTSIINGIELLVAVIILASLIVFLDRKQSARNEELRDDIKALDERQRGIEGNVTQNVNQIEELRGDIKALDERQRGIEGNVNRVQGSLDTLLHMFRSSGPRPVDHEEAGD